MTDCLPIQDIDHVLFAGRKVKQARKALGLTQQQVAAVASVSDTLISLIENDRGQPLPVATGQRIADALGTPLAELVAATSAHRAREPKVDELTCRVERLERLAAAPTTASLILAGHQPEHAIYQATGQPTPITAVTTGCNVPTTPAPGTVTPLKALFDVVVPLAQADSATLDLIRRVIDQLDGVHLIQIYPPLSAHYLAQMAAIENQPGKRWVIMHGFSDVTVPTDITQQRADRVLSFHAKNDQVADFVRRMVNIQGKRWHNFREHARHFPCRDITLRASLDRLVRDGIYSEDDLLFQLDGTNVEDETQRRAHVQDIIKLLQDKELNYQLAIVDDEDDRGSNIRKLCHPGYLMKEGIGVILEAADPESGHQLNLAIKEPKLVRGFHVASQNLWNELPTLWKNKDYVISQLEAYRDSIGQSEPSQSGRPHIYRIA